MKFFFWQIAGVDKFVSHVNVTLRHKHDQERLNAIVAKIESYDAVESPNDECLRVSHDQISKNCELNCRQIWKERNINKKIDIIFNILLFYSTFKNIMTTLTFVHLCLGVALITPGP